MDKFGHKFGTSFQIKILSALISDRVFFQTVYDIIKPEYFDSESNEWISRTVLSYFDGYEKLPTLDVFKLESDKIQRDVLKLSVVDNLKQVWNALGSDDLDFVKEQTLQFCKNQEVKHAILESVTLLEEGKFDRKSRKDRCSLYIGIKRGVCWSTIRFSTNWYSSSKFEI